MLFLSIAFLLFVPWMFLPFPRLLSLPFIPADAVFLPLAAAVLVHAARRHPGAPIPSSLLRFVTACGSYALAIAAATALSPEPRAGIAACIRALYLAAVGVCFAWVSIRKTNAAFLRIAWFAGLALVLTYSFTGAIAHLTGGPPWLTRVLSGYEGSLPPGPYVRMLGPFLNFNMFATYLAMSAILLMPDALAIRTAQNRWSKWLLSTTALALASTLSPSIGGCLLGSAIFLAWAPIPFPSVRAKQAAAVLLAVGAAGFLAAAAVSPRHIVSERTFAPSPRVLTWKAAAQAWMSSPRSVLFGQGPGRIAFRVEYLPASGNLQLLRDAHQIWMSLAFQSGLLGIGALGAVLISAIAPSIRRIQRTPMDRRDPREVALLAATISLWFYCGLTGSFEDTRHFWICLGLLAGDNARSPRKNGTEGTQ